MASKAPPLPPGLGVPKAKTAEAIVIPEFKDLEPPARMIPGKLQVPRMSLTEKLAPAMPMNAAEAMYVAVELDPEADEEYLKRTDNFPQWMIRESEGSFVEYMTHLCTRDGRKCGNAIVVSDDPFEATILTDAGHLVERLTALTLKEMFHPPEWIVDYYRADKWFQKRLSHKQVMDLPIRFPDD